MFRFNLFSFDLFQCHFYFYFLNLLFVFLLHLILDLHSYKTEFYFTLLCCAWCFLHTYSHTNHIHAHFTHAFRSKFIEQNTIQFYLIVIVLFIFAPLSTDHAHTKRLIFLYVCILMTKADRPFKFTLFTF